MLNYNDSTNKYIVYKGVSAIVGLVVGDALGVPVEFSNREKRKKDLVTDMRGYGTHSQPPGTWSDDSSMTIATLEWFRDFRNSSKGSFDDLDYNKLMDKFSSWMLNGEYTPYGKVFDMGIATSKAIFNYGIGIPALKCGGVGEHDNGNGSLMRILPGALFFYTDSEANVNEEYIPYIYNLSSLTHGHARSRLACLIYSVIIDTILRSSDKSKIEMLDTAVKKVSNYLLEYEDDISVISEEDSYNRIWNVESFAKLNEEDINSSGYVVDTLEAAIWCFLNTDSYRECVLKAVNLGGDTDTIGAVAGGLAGLYYGIENIPVEWVSVIPKIDIIMNLTKDAINTTE